ncbi:asparagine synthase (glutamine-hydrolyzing) [Vibrio cyclitrophicus]|nr:asparagine synthase (glutamine-hydrolyzing) [Vibrio cyclitrophicus]UPR52366.1 asparagine synthase (glutamine-hydrolyzing) [Vibrio cyclitrophicus]
MCGISGFITSDLLESRSIISKMNDTLIHRGPDSGGIWVGECDATNIALGHRRLAIQDLSAAGHQPMMSESNRYSLIFNGEIYNHLALRAELGNIFWKGHSDTETILACIEMWGFQDTIKKLKGMFAIALWDFVEKKLFLTRDRVGEKPLYYGSFNNSFVFSSELKAFNSFPHFKKVVNRDSLSLYLRYNYIPVPFTIYNDVFKMVPGTIIEVGRDLVVSEYSYWDPSYVVESGVKNTYKGTYESAVKELESLISESIRSQTISDVPFGAFLSGGIDSSLVVALMQKQLATPVKTFTIGFHNEAYNEAEHAKAISKHLGTEHTELYLNDDDAMAVIKELACIYDEPFADSSQIPTYLVSKMAKEYVTVVLSGDGGDELFAGYNRHKLAQTQWPMLVKCPLFIRSIVSKLIKINSPEVLNNVNYILPRHKKMRLIGDKLHKASDSMVAKDHKELYLSLVSQWSEPEKIVINSNEPASLALNNELSSSLSPTEYMMALDMITYMSDDILVKVDRASMANSLETRVPLLDHSIIEYAWSLPLEYKLKNGVTKSPLRDILYKHVPKELIERPKMGFGIPLDSWLRYGLKNWASGLLSPDRLQSEGYFNEPEVTKIWKEHLSGNFNHTQKLWCILMFQAWLDENLYVGEE